jgi:isopenicillin N synthase-like dioxygenase
MATTEVDLIPVLSLGPFRAGEPGSAAVAASRLADALERIGFFFVVDHGLDWALVEETYRQARRLHALTDDRKEAIVMDAERGGYLRLGGGTSYASAIAGEVRKPNLNAAYFVQRDPSGRRNQWPDLPGFREVVMAYFEAVQTLAHELLPLYALALHLPPGHFEGPFDRPSATLRMSHYPVVDHDEHDWGLAPHTDSSFMTLLPANDIPGLWIRPEGYDWVEPPPLPGSFLVNSGDILKRWTNHRFLSTAHRVRNESGRDRYAIPFFYGPSDDAPVEALPTCVSADRPARYPPTTYGAYQRWFRNRNYAEYTGQEVNERAP